MGIFGAMSTAVSGLKAQSYAMENISGNIANSQTTGFKRTDTSFADMVTGSSGSRQVSGSVRSNSRATNTVQGDIQASTVDTHIALNGEGFFIISEAGGEQDGRPVFKTTPLYTRRGDFELDQNGYLQNGAGYYLNGNMIDPSTGNVMGSVPAPLQLGNSILAATASTRIDYQANLPSYPVTNDSDPKVPGSELLNVASYTDIPPATATGPAGISADEETDFINQSISGESITVYDELGTPVSVQFRWAKTASADPATLPPTNDTWNLFYMSNSTATGTAQKWTNVETDFEFAGGQLVTPTAGNINIPNLTVNGTNVGAMQFQFGTGGLTQFADSNGLANLRTLSQNGYSAGNLVSISINDTGRVSAYYSNGQNADIAQIPVVTFNNNNGLKVMDGGAFSATKESGAAIPSSNASILDSSLEGSNTDIADEFTKLIVTQQAYSANTRIVTSADEMLQEALNMVR